MTTKREAILSRLITQLAGTANVGTRIYRSRVTPVSRSEGAVLIVEPTSDSCETRRNVFQWTLNVRLSVIVRGSSTQTADQVADPIVKSIHDKISTDITLNGKAIDTTPTNVSFDLIDGDQPSGVISCDYRIIYQTSTSDLST